MTDAFQVAGAALAVADLALKIYKELSTFIERAKTADDTARDLIFKVKRFRKTVYTVHATLIGREEANLAEYESREERKIRANIFESLERWNQTLSELKTGIERLRLTPRKDPALDWIGKTLLQLKLDRKVPWISKLETAINSHMDEISLSLNCLQIIIHGETSSYIVRLNERLERLTGANTTYQFIPSGAVTQSQPWPAKGRTIEKCIEVAHSIKSRSSIYSEDVESCQLKRDSLFAELKDSNLDAEDFAEHYTEDEEFDDLVSLPALRPQLSSPSPDLNHNTHHMEGDDNDPTPEFDDTTPQEVLDALIQNYSDQVQTETRDVRHDEAEENQRKMIACAVERNRLYGNRYNIQDAKLTLANILMKKNDDRSWQEASNINATLLKPLQEITPEIPSGSPMTSKPVPERVELSRYYLQRAELYYRKYCRGFKTTVDLDLSEKFAKRSFKLTLDLRHEAREGFLHSIDHLIKVYEHKHDKVAADTYRRLYLNFPIYDHRSASPISPIIPQNTFSRSPQLSRTLTFPEDLDVHNGVDSNGFSHLVSAILEGSPIKVERILQQGADPDQVSKEKSPLMYAIDRGVAEIILHLKNKGAGINTEVKGKTPLIYAIEHRAGRMIELLCEIGVDIEASSRKYTPLLRAAQLKYPEVVRTLCQRKAKINATCSGDYTALHCAISNLYSSSRGEVCETLAVLLENHADPNAKDGEGKTPLHHALQENDKACVSFLLNGSWNIDLEAQDCHGWTPLNFAIRTRQYSLVELCLEKGAIVPVALPKDITRPISDLIKGKRRASATSSSTETASLQGLRSSSSRRYSIETKASTRTSKSRMGFLFGNKSSP